MLLPDPHDKWWEITSTTDVDALVREIADLVLGKGVPYVSRYLDTNELVALWKSGQSPGITETQRTRYVQRFSDLENANLL
jgi:hypothetical protein